MSDDLRPAEAHDLDRDLCLDLLAAGRVGRLVLAGPEPAVVPVNYIVVGDAVVLRTDTTSHLASAVGQHVVFEVDEVDDRLRTAWSVVVRGPMGDAAELVAADGELVHRLEPWAPGAKDCWLQVRVIEITGRHVHAAERAEPHEQRGYL